jgi:hypothetical protein
LRDLLENCRVPADDERAARAAASSEPGGAGMSSSNISPPRSYWVISGVALLWNLVGLAAYIGQVTMSEDAMNALPEAQRVMMETTPAWALGAFAIATTAGVLGCVLLVLRNSWAVPFFLVSLAAVLAQMYYAFVVANAIDLYGGAAIVQPALIIAIGVGLIWYSRYAKEKGWFR